MDRWINLINLIPSNRMHKRRELLLLNSCSSSTESPKQLNSCSSSSRGSPKLLNSCSSSSRGSPKLLNSWYSSSRGSPKLLNSSQQSLSNYSREVYNIDRKKVRPLKATFNILKVIRMVVILVSSWAGLGRSIPFKATLIRLFDDHSPPTFCWTTLRQMTFQYRRSLY